MGDGITNGGVPIGHHTGDQHRYRAIFFFFGFEQVVQQAGSQAVAAIVARDMVQERGFFDDFAVVFAGAVGFGIAGQVSWDLFRVSDAAVLGAVTKVVIWGVVGGTFLGAALGYLEKRKVEREIK